MQRDSAATESEFALFAGDYYYPCGGWEDCIYVYASLADAKASVRPIHDWAHVVDLSICEPVARYERRGGWTSL